MTFSQQGTGLSLHLRSKTEAKPHCALCLNFPEMEELNRNRPPIVSHRKATSIMHLEDHLCFERCLFWLFFSPQLYQFV